jgi:hypothetical protein
MGYCHCASCRSYSGAPLTAFILWRAGDIRVTAGAEWLAAFQSSEMSLRRYCTKCGGHMMTEHPALGYTDVYAAILPTVEFRPTVHLNYEETVFRVNDGLPKLRDFPKHAGGSGEMMPG